MNRPRRGGVGTLLILVGLFEVPIGAPLLGPWPAIGVFLVALVVGTTLWLTSGPDG